MKLLLVLIILPFLAARLLRWLAIIQQKEYRFDRLKIFIFSEEGVIEIFMLPTPEYFSKVSLKRPRLTWKIFFITILSLLLIASALHCFFVVNNILFLIFIIIFYYSVPIIVMISILPFYLINFFVTKIFLNHAKIRLAKHKPTIIGITGSYGKTSTKKLVGHFLSAKYSVFTTPKSFNTNLSIAKSIMQNYNGQEIAVIEYAAYKKGEIKSLTKYFPPDLAVITGISLQHIGLFGNMQNLISAKSELIQALPKNGVVICNAQDKNAVRLCEKSGTKSLKYYASRYSQLINNIKIEDSGKLTFNYDKKKVQTKLIGSHYATNIQAAILVSEQFGISKKEIIDSLKSFKPSNEFISSKNLKTGTLLIDDSETCNLKGFQAATDLVKMIQKKKKILIFAGIVDLGEKSSEIHRKLASEAKNVFSKVLYTGIEGKKIFKDIFKNNLIDAKKNVKGFISNIDNNTLILIEGKIPKDLKEFILSL